MKRRRGKRIRDAGKKLATHRKCDKKGRSEKLRFPSVSTVRNLVKPWIQPTELDKCGMPVSSLVCVGADRSVMNEKQDKFVRCKNEMLRRGLVASGDRWESLKFRCENCGAVWAPNVRPGRYPRGYWRCPKLATSIGAMFERRAKKSPFGFIFHLRVLRITGALLP